jgi:hypothetical protein
MDPVVDVETVDGLMEEEDGSVIIPDEDDVPEAEVSTDFYENLAETLPADELQKITSRYCDLLEKDKEARKRRDEQYEEGIRRTGLSDDAPGGASFSGASKVVHPVLAESSIDFSARAMKELFPPQGPVRTYFVGQPTEGQMERAERKRQYMNWQLTTQMKEYRTELEQLLTQLPLGGSQFQKFWYDEKLKRPVSEFIPIDDILLPYAATNFYTSPRVTHVQHLTELEYRRRIKRGLYRDVGDIAASDMPEQTATALASDKVEGKEGDAYNEDGLRDVYEIYTWLEVSDAASEDEPAPYILTIDKHTKKALALYRNWDELDAKHEKLDWMVEWKFIPWRGAYAIGLPQLIGGLSAAMTGALRALLDSAHINNAASAVKMKGGKLSGTSKSVELTQITELECPPGVDDIRKAMMPLPFNPPSPVLFQLLGFLETAARGVVATADDKMAQVGDRTPVGTTMAMIEQGSVTYSSIHARLHDSQAKSLNILQRLNAQWLDDEEVIEDLESLVVSKQDFIKSGDIIPVSDPAIFSEGQRFAQTQALVQMSTDQTVPWNKIEVYRRALKQMRIESPDTLLPAPPKPVTADCVQENAAASAGMQLKAAPQQDHMAQIQGHLMYVEFNLQNPLANIPALSAILAHIGEHIQMYQLVTTQQMAQQVAIQAQSNGQQRSPDSILAMAQAQAFSLMSQQLAPVIQKLGPIQQQIQQKTPPPPMPPEVQATLQIAQMENQRKTNLDNASIQLEQATQQAKQAAEQASFQMEQMAMAAEQQREQQRLATEQSQAQFSQQLEVMKVTNEDQLSKLSQQVEIMKNEQDNRQHQMTELLKNRDDNQTQIIIEKLKQSMAEIAPSAEPAPDMGPQLKELQSALDRISQDKTHDALTSVMQGLQETMKQLSAPKMLIRDAQGKAQGIQTKL